jgi:hypothetical protein
MRDKKGEDRGKQKCYIFIVFPIINNGCPVVRVVTLLACDKTPFHLRHCFIVTLSGEQSGKSGKQILTCGVEGDQYD